MAIYHLSAKIISRQSGRSVVAAAAYRASQSLYENSTGLTHDYTRKQGVEHSEILAPKGAPEWVFDRLELWNRVEAAEKRKDAQLAREIEVGLPVELSKDAQLSLVRAYVQRELVAKGMTADFSIHRDDPNNPHAHILLTMRKISKDGFGPKERSWNDRSQLLAWRVAWEEVTNEHLAQAGLAVRIDHRSLAAQGSSFAPGRKIGVGKERQELPGLPLRVAERIAEQRQIAQENGRRILANPRIAIDALTHHQATFTTYDIAKFLHTRTEGAEQFQAALLKVTTLPELVRLGIDDRRQVRFTSRTMLKTEQAMLERAQRMTAQAGHTVSDSRQRSVLSQHGLSAEQEQAFKQLIESGDLKALVGVAGSGKSRLLSAAREAWEAQGFTVKGAALSGIAAENLGSASGIASRTIASYEYAWAAERDPLTARDVLVIDETGMIGTRQLARVLEAAETAHAKVVLVGDPEQLQAIEAGAAFRGVLGQSGFAQLQEVRRQRVGWQREATQQLAGGLTDVALKRYEEEGGLIQVDSHEAARRALITRWAFESAQDSPSTRLILAYTREDVKVLNGMARALRVQRKELGRSETIQTESGKREFAAHDRLYFLRNERSLGVKNGSLGTIEAVKNGVLQVRLDTGDRIAFDTGNYRDLDYGYAATVYKAQGSTVDRAYVLASSHFDRHSVYVALSRHREGATVYYASEDFGEAGSEDRSAARERFFQSMSRARPKELAHDYLEQRVDDSGQSVRPSGLGRPSMDDIAERQLQAALRWKAKQSHVGHSRESVVHAGQTHNPTRSGDYASGRSGPEDDLDV